MKNTYIPVDQCKHGFLYKLDSRNLSLGVYKNSTRGFSGIRTKFSSRFVFEEYHWDIGAPFGTAKPLMELCECPVPVALECDLLDWLNEQELIWK